jgi:drug/metabolite transporter (DMT)-like permease
MRIQAAYATVVLLWGTTPLAIKWSGDGPGFLFGVIARMTVGAVCVLTLLLLARQPLPLGRPALWSYAAGAVQIYGAMICVYWASQFIPSGWISVVFGLSPLITALMAFAWLGERALGLRQLSAFALGATGLWALFGSARVLGGDAVHGIVGVLVSAVLQCTSAVWIKRLDARIPALAQLAGSLLLAMPAYLATWVFLEEAWPQYLSERSIAAILYLGVIATTLGLSLYFYLLSRITATALSLISLVSPVLALLIGRWIDSEPVTANTVFGTSLILASLILFQGLGRFSRTRAHPP